MKSRIFTLIGFGVLALSLTGCPPKAQVKKEEPPKPEEAQKPVEEPSLRGKEYKEVPELSTVYFELDQFSLRNDARGVLQKNYEVLKKHADWEVLVEGNTDERGTTEYNLGLGQRRAAAVRQYYRSLGMSGARIATLSYGKEKAACEEHTDDCWSKNRRADTKVRINAETAPAKASQ